MTTLDIDMGNTRTKWRCGQSTGALPSPGLPALSCQPSRVRVATVLGNRQILAHRVTETYGVAAEFAATARELAGVRCGYGEPARLGVDRWLAMVAAWRSCAGAVMVVSAGTAATVDFVDAAGRHQGGYIVPGLRALRDALRRETAEVRPDDEVTADASPGLDTQRAVSSGTFVMVLAFVEAAIRRFRAHHGDEAAVYLTGGDAALLAEALSEPLRHEPHLVLDGLAVALP